MTKKPTTLRGRMWLSFADDVLEHIEDYTVPQYGDAPNDLASTWTEHQMIDNIDKYIRRAKTHVREDCRYTDLLKIAHYSCMIYHKRKEQLL